MAIVGVYQFPSDNELVWRMLMSNEALAKGWLYREHALDVATIEPGASVLFVTSDPEMIDLAGVDAWTVIGADLDRAAALLVERLGMGDDSLWHIARRGVAADTLLRQGYALFDTSDDAIDIAGFGRISAGPQGDSPRRSPTGPLALYSQLPVPVGARAVWSTAVYKLATEVMPGLEPIDLTGKARLLIQGPYFDLTPGVWTVTLDVEVEAPAWGVPLVFEWGHGADVAELSVTVRDSGLYRIVMEHGWTAPAHADLRITLPQPTFHGGLTFVGSEIVRTA